MIPVGWSSAEVDIKYNLQHIIELYFRQLEIKLFFSSQPAYVCGKFTHVHIQSLDQYQYLGNCPPTPPLTQQQSIDNKLGLMLG